MKPRTPGTRRVPELGDHRVTPIRAGLSSPRRCLQSPSTSRARRRRSHALICRGALSGWPWPPAFHSSLNRPLACRSSVRAPRSTTRPCIEHDDFVDLFQAVQPVGDQQEWPAVGGRQQVVGERRGGSGVEVGGGFVQHQQREVGEQGAGQDEPLPLAGRHPNPRSPTCVSRPSARPSTQSSSRTRCRASRTVASSQPGRDSRRFSRTVESKTCASCAQSPTIRRTSSPARARTSCPPRQ